jgi:exonuclease III
MTWNIEQFPKHSNTTSSVITIINDLHPSIIAFQEINSISEFDILINKIDNYDGFRASSASYGINLAYIWDTNSVKNVNIYEIFQDEWYPFPRSPLVMECKINNLNYIIINNHFKCCDDGVSRREEAVTLIKDYMDNNYQNDRIIMLGDFNDNLNDSEYSNVFMPLLEDRDKYLFIDENFEIDNYSYPSYPSHIDHILISNELFPYFNSQYTETYTIQLDDEIQFYFSQISDHLPVYLKLVFE